MNLGHYYNYYFNKSTVLNKHRYYSKRPDEYWGVFMFLNNRNENAPTCSIIPPTYWRWFVLFYQ